jgi:hypothetical protein
MEINGTLGIIAAMVSLLSVSTLYAQPTVIRNSADESHFTAIEAVCGGGGAALVYGQAPGVYTFTTQAAAASAVEAMNNALNAEANITGVGVDVFGGRPGAFFHIGYEGYDPGLGSVQVRAQSSYSVVVTRLEERPTGLREGTGLTVIRDDVSTDAVIKIINLVVSNIVYDVDVLSAPASSAGSDGASSCCWHCLTKDRKQVRVEV